MADTLLTNSERTTVQQAWRWSKPFQRPTVPLQQHAEAQRQWPYHAALLTILLACYCSTGPNMGTSPQPLQTSSQLVSRDSTGQYQLQLYSTVTAVDVRLGRAVVEFTANHVKGDHIQYCRNEGPGWQYELVIGSTAPTADQVVLPVCLAATQQPFTVHLPLRRLLKHSPYESHSSQLLVRIQRSALHAATQHGLQEHVPGGPLVTWSATWTAADLEVAVNRGARYRGVALSAPTPGFSSNQFNGLGGDMSDQLQPLMYTRQDEAVYVMELTRSSWCRIIHLTALLLQLLAVGYCVVMALGHVLCAILMQRLLCSRVHGVWQ